MGAKINKLVKGTHKKVVVPLGDLLLGRVMSKKLTVFFIATAFVLAKYLDGPEWVEVAKWYFGTQGAVDVTTAAVTHLKPKNKIDSKLEENLENEQP